MDRLYLIRSLLLAGGDEYRLKLRIIQVNTTFFINYNVDADMCREKGSQLYKSRVISIKVLSTVVVASERVQHPSEHASSDIFNMAYIWDYPKGSG